MNGQRVIDGNELKHYVNSFVGTTFIFGREWSPREMPQLHSLVPCDVITMFWYWYKAEQRDSHIVVVDGSHLISLFEEVLKGKNVKFNYSPRNSNNYEEYNYKFSSLRLTTRGVEFYHKLLRNEIASY